MATAVTRSLRSRTEESRSRPTSSFPSRLSRTMLHYSILTFIAGSGAIFLVWRPRLLRFLIYFRAALAPAGAAAGVKRRLRRTLARDRRAFGFSASGVFVPRTRVDQKIWVAVEAFCLIPGDPAVAHWLYHLSGAGISGWCCRCALGSGSESYHAAHGVRGLAGLISRRRYWMSIKEASIVSGPPRSRRWVVEAPGGSRQDAGGLTW